MIIRSDFEIFNLVELLEVMIIFYLQVNANRLYIVCNFCKFGSSKNSSSSTPVATTRSKFRHSPLLSFTEKTTAAIMSTGKDFAISGTAASLSHLIHHPLYTLKSQMMYHGKNFSLRRFVRQVVSQPTFLYNGELIKLIT